MTFAMPSRLRRLSASLPAVLFALALAAPVQAAPLDYRVAVFQSPGVLSYLPFDDLAYPPGSGGWEDYTGRRNTEDLTHLSGGQYGADVRPELNSPVNSGAHFEGADPDGTWESHLNLGYVFSFGSRQPLTVETWLRADSADSVTRRVFSKEEPAGGWLLGARGGRLVFSRYHRGGTFRLRDQSVCCRFISKTQTANHDTVSVPLSSKVWHHVAATYDGTQMEIILDGRLVARRLSDLRLNRVESSATVGATARGWREWDGALDELAVFNRAIGPAEVYAHLHAFAR